MRKLFTLVLFLVGLNATAQTTWLPQPYRYKFKMGMFDSSFKVPVLPFLYAPYANQDSIGRIVYWTGDNQFYGQTSRGMEQFLTSSFLSARYIQNTQILQPSAGYNIDGKGTIKSELSAGMSYSKLVLNPLDTIYFFGTSITMGTGAGAGLRFSTKTIAGTGGKERNYGIGSSTMEQGIPPRPLGARSMIDTLDGVPVKNARGRLIVIEYGLNDMGCNAPGYDTAFFKRDYRITLDTIRARGWNMKDVLLFGPEYIPDSGYRKYAAINSGNGVPTRERHLQYVDAVREIAAEYGTHWFNMYDSMVVHGGASIIGADSLHPNNAGHGVMANIIIDYLKKNYGSDVNSSLFVDSTKVTSPKIIVGNTLDDGTGLPLQVTGNVSLTGDKTIISNVLGAFTGEIAVTRGGDTYTAANYGGFHIQPSGTGTNTTTVIGTVGRGTVRAGALLIQKSNQIGGVTTLAAYDSTGNVGIGNFVGANMPRAKLDIANGAIKIRQTIIGDPVTDSLLVKSATDSTIRTLGIDQIAAGGSVTSVGLSLPSIFSVTGSPVTSSGTLTGTLTTQTANTIFAGPGTGAAAIPTFRSLVSDDIPSLDAAKISTGLFGSSRLATGTGTSANFIRGDQVYTNELLGGLIATATSGAQYTNQYNASNRLTITTGSTGTTTYALTGTSPVNSFSQGVNVLGGLSTATSNTAANFYAPGLGTAAATTAQNSLFGGATLVAFRSVLRGNTTLALTANENATNLLVGRVPYTTAATGIHEVVTGTVSVAPLVTGGGSAVKKLSAAYFNNPYTFGMINCSIISDTGLAYIKEKMFLGLTPVGLVTDSILVKGATDSIIKAVATSSIIGTQNLQGVTSNVNGNNTNQLIQIKGTAGATLPGSALELRMDSTSTPTSYITSISRPTNVPIPLNIQSIVGSYTSPAVTQLGSGSNSITRIATGTGTDSSHTSIVLGASISYAQRYTTSNTTLTVADRVIIAANSSGSINLILPTASSCYASGLGRIFTIVKKSAALNNVVIVPITGSTISGQATLTLAIQYSSVTIQSDGTDWFILSSNVGGASL